MVTHAHARRHTVREHIQPALSEHNIAVVIVSIGNPKMIAKFKAETNFVGEVSGSWVVPWVGCGCRC